MTVQGLTGKVFIVDRKKICRGIWKSLEHRGKEADWVWPGLSVKEGRLVGEKGGQRRQGDAAVA